MNFTNVGGQMGDCTQTIIQSHNQSKILISEEWIFNTVQSWNPDVMYENI